MTSLRNEEREFFSLISRAAFANPFSDERTRLDLKISGLFPGVSYEEQIRQTVLRVQEFIDRFESEGRAEVSRFSGDDRLLVEHALLFDIFHRFIEPFDQFIQEQIKAGSRSLKVPFASKFLSLMRKRGFSMEEAARYFALFFQMRRAFFFIHGGLVGRSPCMKDLRKKLWNNVFTHNLDIYNRYLWNRMEDFSTLLLGETGTGKGTASASVGRSGFIPFDPESGTFADSFSGAFISLNLSQFPETLIESELFGHKKGSFTGATDNFKGIFERCSPHGAIFLDEIGEISEPIQIKLLQVIQERWFHPVGSHKKRRFEGRVIAATNRPIDKLHGEAGILRDDLYYRLCSDIIIVPPLRQRLREDLGELDDLLAITLTRIMGGPSPELAETVKKRLLKSPGAEYPWPGNVRELEQYVRRILLDPDNAEAEARSESRESLASWLKGGIENASLNMNELSRGYCQMLYKQYGTYEAVARKTDLDRRTVKKYITENIEK